MPNSVLSATVFICVNIVLKWKRKYSKPVENYEETVVMGVASRKPVVEKRLEKLDLLVLH